MQPVGSTPALIDSVPFKTLDEAKQEISKATWIFRGDAPVHPNEVRFYETLQGKVAFRRYARYIIDFDTKSGQWLCPKLRTVHLNDLPFADGEFNFNSDPYQSLDEFREALCSEMQLRVVENPLEACQVFIDPEIVLQDEPDDTYCIGDGVIFIKKADRIETKKTMNRNCVSELSYMPTTMKLMDRFVDFGHFKRIPQEKRGFYVDTLQKDPEYLVSKQCDLGELCLMMRMATRCHHIKKVYIEEINANDISSEEIFKVQALLMQTNCPELFMPALKEFLTKPEPKEKKVQTYNFARFFNSPIHSDLEIQIGDYSVRAHSIVVAGATTMDISGPELTIDHPNPEVVIRALEFIYKGETTFTYSQAVEAFHLAHEWGCESLIDYCDTLIGQFGEVGLVDGVWQKLSYWAKVATLLNTKEPSQLWADRYCGYLMLSSLRSCFKALGE